MQNAETVLDLLRERGERGLPVERLYRQLFNPQLYLLAYGRIYSNKGAMTPGATKETADGMSVRRIERIIDALRHERYRFAAVRRVRIPKKGGGTRPLGLPAWSDKLLGEVIRLLLEAYYEPGFSDRSHGYRSGRGCHTALREVAETWSGTAWFIEGDIADCFGSLDHEVMLKILSEKIHDNRFLRLIRNMLNAGYLEDWVWHQTSSGAPQGGVVSPILSNIYLHKLDVFVETVLIPQYTRGQQKAINPEYRKVSNQRTYARQRGDREQARELLKRLRRLSTRVPRDPEYRRLRYSRYADDHLLGFIGPKAEAEEIRDRLAAFLRDELRLELSVEKTLVTHARTRAARYLGYEIIVQRSDTKLAKIGRRAKARSINGIVKLRVPDDVIKAKCAPYMVGGKPAHRTPLIDSDDYQIVRTYGSEYRGIVQYYLLAQDVCRLERLRWVAETSMLKTLAAKHRSSVSKMAARYRATITTPQGKLRCFEARVERPGKQTLVARFGGFSLRRQKRAVIDDRFRPWITYPRKEVVGRLRKGRCELCQTKGDTQVHQIPKLADLENRPAPRPEWATKMVRMRRKTLMVCESCHLIIHESRPTTASTN